jgi:hypothetical protein
VPTPAWHALLSLYNRALAAVALHHTGRTSLNRIFGAAIMLARIRLRLIQYRIGTPVMKMNWRNMAALTLFAAATVTAGSATAADIKEVRFGVEASYAPFESKSPSGELQGFDIDIGEMRVGREFV